MPMASSALRAFHATLALAAGAAAAFGCNAPPAPLPARAPTAQASKASPIEPRIAGVVRLSATGKPPTSGGVVYLEDAPKQPGIATTAAINIDHKVLSPFLSVIVTGGTVTFGNKDALTHHIFSPDVPRWDTGYLNKNETAHRTFESPGTVALLCNIHPEMLAYLVVVPSTYFARFEADGSYSIENVPPGTYRIRAWVPRTANATQSVTVTAAGTATANFDLRWDATTD
jgi:plastocyanin